MVEECSENEHAVISYAVAQRTREIGIRMALGAQQRELKTMFVRNGLLWGGIGAAAGPTAAGRAFTGDVHAAIRDQSG
jgi:ABC-type lipoprotein release transport system permease subunit